MKTIIAKLFVCIAAALTLQGQTTYEVSNLPSLGGSSAGLSINNRDWIAGSSNFAGDSVMHATLWRDGVLTDLGTLGGVHSSVLWPVKSNNGRIAGVAETGEPNPRGEIWSCGYFFPTITRSICRGFVWENDVMTPLSTLGGYNSFAAGMNDRGQVVGWAENDVEDPLCVAPQVFQFHAVVWDRNGDIQKLEPLPGDSSGSATAINARGQIVGISGICDRAFGRFSARHAVLWDRGTVTDLGDLGGVAWNTPTAINDRGDIVGFANVPGGATPGSFFARAFIKTPKDETMRELERLPGHTLGQALGINNRGQVVGLSCTPGFASCTAFLWEDGVIVDLNERVPGYDGVLLYANDINDAGEITGAAYLPATGETVAFKAVPRP